MTLKKGEYHVDCAICKGKLRVNFEKTVLARPLKCGDRAFCPYRHDTNFVRGVTIELGILFTRLKLRMGEHLEAWLKRPKKKRNARKRAQKEARRKRGLL